MDNIENNMTFEEALTSLREIVSSLENGDAPLDESLALFEKGVGLIKLCNEMLDSAEQRVTMITSETKEANGEDND